LGGLCDNFAFRLIRLKKLPLSSYSIGVSAIIIQARGYIMQREFI